MSVDPRSRLAAALTALLCAGAAAGLAALAPPALGDDEGFERERDHERARAALERGEVMPLADILAAVRPRIPGEIVEAEFEKEDGVWVYEIKFIDPSGRMVEVYVDARTADIIGIEDD